MAGRCWCCARWTAPTRMLHPAADCYRGWAGASAGSGWNSTTQAAAVALLRGRTRRRAPVRVCERIVDAEGRGFTDTSAWYWAALLRPVARSLASRHRREPAVKTPAPRDRGRPGRAAGGAARGLRGPACRARAACPASGRCRWCSVPCPSRRASPPPSVSRPRGGAGRCWRAAALPPSRGRLHFGWNDAGLEVVCAPCTLQPPGLGDAPLQLERCGSRCAGSSSSCPATSRAAPCGAAGAARWRADRITPAARRSRPRPIADGYALFAAQIPEVGACAHRRHASRCRPSSRCRPAR